MIVRSAFVEGAQRHRELFSVSPPAYVLQHVERVPMIKGRYDPKISTATAYVWLIWLLGQSDTRLRWLPPCRKRFERVSDIEIAASE